MGIKEKNIVEGIVEILEKREKRSVRESERNELQEKIVYAKGLMKGGMSEMVEFEGLGLKGIINYLDKNKKAGITVLGSINEVKVGSRVKRLGKLPLVLLNKYGMLIREVNLKELNILKMIRSIGKGITSYTNKHQDYIQKRFYSPKLTKPSYQEASGFREIHDMKFFLMKFKSFKNPFLDLLKYTKVDLEKLLKNNGWWGEYKTFKTEYKLSMGYKKIHDLMKLVDSHGKLIIAEKYENGKYIVVEGGTTTKSDDILMYSYDIETKELITTYNTPIEIIKNMEYLTPWVIRVYTYKEYKEGIKKGDLITKKDDSYYSILNNTKQYLKINIKDSNTIEVTVPFLNEKLIVGLDNIDNIFIGNETTNIIDLDYEKIDI